MVLQSKEGRAFFFKSSWLSEDKTVAALKDKLGVSELQLQMVETVEEQAALVAVVPPADPIVIQVNLSSKAIWVIIAVNVVVAAASVLAAGLLL